LQLGEAVAAALDAKRSADAGRIIETLTPLAREIVIDERRTELEVLRAAFLVERKRLTRFDSAVAASAQAQASTTNVKYTGPLAPHHFVQLENVGVA